MGSVFVPTSTSSLTGRDGVPPKESPFSLNATATAWAGVLSFGRSWRDGGKLEPQPLAENLQPRSVVSISA